MSSAFRWLAQKLPPLSPNWDGAWSDPEFPYSLATSYWPWLGARKSPSQSEEDSLEYVKQNFLYNVQRLYEKLGVTEIIAANDNTKAFCNHNYNWLVDRTKLLRQTAMTDAQRNRIQMRIDSLNAEECILGNDLFTRWHYLCRNRSDVIALFEQIVDNLLECRSINDVSSQCRKTSDETTGHLKWLTSPVNNIWSMFGSAKPKYRPVQYASSQKTTDATFRTTSGQTAIVKISDCVSSHCNSNNASSKQIDCNGNFANNFEFGHDQTKELSENCKSLEAYCNTFNTNTTSINGNVNYTIDSGNSSPVSNIEANLDEVFSHADKSSSNYLANYNSKMRQFKPQFAPSVLLAHNTISPISPTAVGGPPKIKSIQMITPNRSLTKDLRTFDQNSHLGSSSTLNCFDGNDIKVDTSIDYINDASQKAGILRKKAALGLFMSDSICSDISASPNLKWKKATGAKHFRAMV